MIYFYFTQSFSTLKLTTIYFDNFVCFSLRCSLCAYFLVVRRCSQQGPPGSGPPGPGTPIMPSPQGELSFLPAPEGWNLLPPPQLHTNGHWLTDVDVCVFLFFLIIINQIRLVQEGTACTRWWNLCRVEPCQEYANFSSSLSFLKKQNLLSLPLFLLISSSFPSKNTNFFVVLFWSGHLKTFG